MSMYPLGKYSTSQNRRVVLSHVVVVDSARICLHVQVVPDCGCHALLNNKVPSLSLQIMYLVVALLVTFDLLTCIYSQQGND